MKTKHAVALAFVAGIVYRNLVGLQGVDATDMGFCNTFYQVIFSAPDSNTFNFIYYLTGLLGGLWELTFGGLGLLGFRAFESLTLAAAILLMHLTFRDRMPGRHSVCAVALSFLFPTIVVTFHYDTLSYLLVAASVYFFQKSLRGGYLAWSLAAGAMLGLSFFARIVNLSLLALPAVALLYWWRTDSPAAGLRRGGALFAGVLLGCAAVVGVMASLGHLPYYAEALAEGFSTLGRSDDTHSADGMLSSYFKSFVNVAAQLAAIAVMWALWLRAGRMSGRRACVAVRCALAVALLVLVFTSQSYLSLLSACTFVCLVWMTRHDAKAPDFALLVYILVAAYLFPLGSDTGIQSIFNWCAGLMVFPAAFCLQCFRRKGFAACVGVCVALCAVAGTLTPAYGESEPRLRCTEVLQPGRLNVLVPRGKADEYRRLIGAISRHAGEGGLLLLGNQDAALYYATRTRPYLGHVQTKIYAGRRLEERLDERAAHFGRLPVVVLYAGRHIDNETENHAIIRRWMARRGYRLAYDDGFARLYVPGRRQGGPR